MAYDHFFSLLSVSLLFHALNQRHCNNPVQSVPGIRIRLNILTVNAVLTTQSTNTIRRTCKFRFFCYSIASIHRERNTVQSALLWVVTFFVRQKTGRPAVPTSIHPKSIRNVLRFQDMSLIVIILFFFLKLFTTRQWLLGSTILQAI